MRKKRLFILLMLPVLLSGTVFAYYLLVTLPGDRAERILQEARRAITHQQLKLAESKLLQARDFSRTRDRASLDLFDLIFISQPGTARELLEDIKSRAGETPAVLAREVVLSDRQFDTERLQEVKAVLSEDEQFMSLYALLLIHFNQGDTESSVEVLKQLKRDFATYPLTRLISGRILAGKESSLNRIVAKEQLLSLLRPASIVSFDAALVLLTAPELMVFPADRQSIGEALLGHPWLDECVEYLQPIELEILATELAADAPQAAFYFSRFRLERTEVSARDRILHLEIASRLNLQDTVADLVQEMTGMTDLTPEEHLALVRFAFESTQFEDGLERLQGVLEKHPANPSVWRLLALYGSDRAAQLPLDAQLTILNLLSEHPLTTSSVALNVFQSLIAKAPESRSRYIAQAVEKFRSSEPVLLAEWLNLIGEYDSSLEIIPESMALTNPAAFSARVNALLGEGKITSAQSLASSVSGMLDPLALAISMARIYHMDEQEERSQNALGEAVQLAIHEERANLLVSLGQIANELGHLDIQLKAFDTAFRMGAVFSDTAAIAYLRALLSTDEITAAEEFSSFCRSLSPENPLYINNDCYVQIIQQKNIPESVSAMRPVVSDNPTINAFRGTLALAHFLNNEPRTALSVLEDGELSSTPKSSQESMIFALILIGNDETGLAEKIMAGLDVEQLNTSEVELLRSFGLISSRS